MTTMIRKIFTAALVLSPTLLHAQASPPGQRNAPIRLSTGIVAPQLVSTSDIPWDTEPTATQKTIIVHMTVDASGKPVNLSVVRSINPAMDSRVLQSVSQYRFKPGTLDNTPQAIPLNLEIVVRNPNYR
jgi:hypothetical protein